MIQARIHQGRIEVQEPIPQAWEGWLVRIVPSTPDDPSPALEQSLAALHALGSVEFEANERESIDREMAALDGVSKDQMAQLLPQPR